MKNLRQPMVHVTIRVFLTISNLCVLAATGSAVADEEPSHIDPGGTWHIRELSIPPSDLWSPEFKEFYLGWTREVSTRSWMKFPARNASKAEWDRFDARNEDHFAEPLAAVLKRYPVKVVDTKIGGVHVGVISPKAPIAPENQHRVLINLRGGGFVANRGLSFGQLEAVPVASIGRIKVITVDYRQAPFHAYPAATEDVETVYKELLKQYKAEAIGIFGCSAGGALTAQTVAWLQARRLPRPGAVGIFCSGPTPTWFQRNGDSGIWVSSTPKSQLARKDETSLGPMTWYMDGADRNDAVAYPSSDAVLARFPPTMFLSGTRDLAMSSVVVAHTRLLKLGVDSSLYIMEGAPHAAHLIAVGTPEAHDAHAYIARWFIEHLAP